MHLRCLSLLIAALALSPQSLLAAPDAAMPKGVLPVTAVYLAKGPADSCGSGCDRWIAVEGKMDSAAAARLRSFFRAQKDARLPVYLHSPGGDVRQALAMGRLLRERKATGRVARTIVKECGADGQGEPACAKLKQSGRELEAELTETGAFCNSSCVYLLLGASTREVPPDVTLGVHSARVTISYSGRGRAPLQVAREHAAKLASNRLDRDIVAYAAAMGIDRGLFDLVKTVKFEQIHALKRDELIRFGIDRRKFVETPWRFGDNGVRFFIDKVVQERTGTDPATIRTLRWQLSCWSAQQLRLAYARTDVAEALASAVIRFGADEKVVLAATTALAPQLEIRMARLDLGMTEKLKSAAQISLMEVGKAPEQKDAAAAVRETVLSTEGLARSVDQLSRRCSP